MNCAPKVGHESQRKEGQYFMEKEWFTKEMKLAVVQYVLMANFVITDIGTAITEWRREYKLAVLLELAGIPGSTYYDHCCKANETGFSGRKAPVYRTDGTKKDAVSDGVPFVFRCRFARRIFLLLAAHDVKVPPVPAGDMNAHHVPQSACRLGNDIESIFIKLSDPSGFVCNVFIIRRADKRPVRSVLI